MTTMPIMPKAPQAVPLGRTSLAVTRFGLGCAPLAGLFAPVGERTARETLEEAWAGGVRYFDTAPHYGFGLSERRVGEFLRTRPRHEFVLSTKVGRLLVPGGSPAEDSFNFFGGPNGRRVFDFTREGVVASLESSLERLGLDRVDIALIHDPDDHFADALDGAYPALAEMKDQGLVGAIGLGMNQTAMLERFVNETDIDVILVAGRYSLLDDRAGRSLLPACLARGVAVEVAAVFNSGILVDPTPGATFDYLPADQPLVDRAIELSEITAAHGVALSAVALQWPLRHRAVTGVVVGARSGAEVREDLAGFGTVIPDALWDDLANSGLLGWRDPAPG
jgi:D-threo-aldose 1-dehydrogenase